MNSIRMLFTTTVLCLIASASQAQITISLTPSTTMPIVPGSSISWSGTLTNTGASDLFINGDQILVNPSDPFTIDDTPLLTPVQLFPLTAGSSYTGLLFTLTAPSFILNKNYTGSLTLLGGTDTFTTNPIGTQNFSFRAVPEPGATGLLVGVALTGAGIMLRRRKK